MSSLATRLMGRASRAAHLGVAAVAIWAVGLAALTAVIALQQRSDTRRTGQILVGELRRQQGELPGIVFQSGLGNDVGVAVVRQRLAVAERRIAATERELGRSTGATHSVAIRAASRRYLRDLDRVFASVSAGRLTLAARQLGRTERPGGSATVLRSELVAASVDSGRQADAARKLAAVGSALAIVLALLAFSAALVRARTSVDRLGALAAQNEELLARSRLDEARYRELFENATEPIATVDLNWRLTEVNTAFERALGRGRETLLGSSLSDYLSPAGQRLSAYHRARKLAGEETSATYEQEFVHPEGGLVIFEVSTRLLEENGRPIGVQGMCRDITDRKAAEASLRGQVEMNRQQALHDALTGLPNRVSFTHCIEREIAAISAGRAGSSSGFAVLMIDLDRFKEVNDSLGHHSGDRLLQEIGARLAGELRGRDTVARLGGDEFGLLLADSGETSAWRAAVERITAALELPLVVEGLPLSVEASIGVAFHPTQGTRAEQLLQHADVAMYEAKRRGLAYAVYDPDVDRADTANLTLLGELRRALTRKELVLHYQPKIDLRTGGLARVEALIRWEHPDLGLLPPSMFMPLAEQTGLIEPLTRYVLEEAARQCHAWERDGLRTAVAVNVSARNLVEPDLAENVAGVLKKWHLEPERLLLEVTETAIAVDAERCERALWQLSALGVGLALDDFGAGYTAISHLARLPLDQVKIDQALIRGITTDSRDLSIVQSIVGLAHDLGLHVVAEGVEEQETVDALVRLDCDLAQGFHLCPPLPPDELLAWASPREQTIEHPLRHRYPRLRPLLTHGKPIPC